MPKKWIVFITVAIGAFMSMLSATSINVALPIMEREFSASLAGIQWVVTAYMLVISSVLPIFGWAGDMTQRRYVIASGFLVFGLGGFLCAHATTLGELILSRMLQGLGASMNMANSYAAVTSVFPPAERGRALGLMGSMVALGSLSGPAVGGFLLEYFHWSAIFYSTLPFALAGCVMASRHIPLTPPHKAGRFDLWGALMIIGAIASLVISISQWGRAGWSDLEIAGYLLSAILLFSLLLRRETRIESPIIDLGMFRNRIFMFGNLAGLCSFLALNTNSMLMPFYLHHIMDASPKTMGMIMMIFPVTMVAAAPLSGSLSDRYGAPPFAISGMALMTASLLLLVATAHVALLWLLVVTLALFGASNGIFQAPNNLTTLAVVPVEKHGAAGSIVALMRNLGAVIGISLSVRICDKVAELYMAGQTPTPQLSNDAFIVGYQAALLVGAGFAFLGMLFSLGKKRSLSGGKNHA